MLIIGLTGGIASGKSTVASYFQALGITVINSDQIAKELTRVGMPALQQIVSHFGPEILNPTQELNRRLLRERIMADEAARLWLEQLLHPLILKELQARAKQVHTAYCVLEIPLLVETGPYPFIDRILVVDVEEATQLARLQTRDHLSLALAQQTLANQAQRAARLAAADDVLENQGDLARLKQAVAKLHEKYLGLVR